MGGPEPPQSFVYPDHAPGERYCEGIHDFTREFGTLARMPNRGRGLTDWERVLVYADCLRGNRRRICRELMAGEEGCRPDIVLESVQRRAIKSYEDPFDQRQGALYAFERIGKGYLTAAQFGLAFGDGCRELEKAGYVRSRTELLYAYLGKVGPEFRFSILKDRRNHGDPRGDRRACRWRRRTTC